MLGENRQEYTWGSSCRYAQGQRQGGGKWDNGELCSCSQIGMTHRHQRSVLDSSSAHPWCVGTCWALAFSSSQPLYSPVTLMPMGLILTDSSISIYSHLFWSFSWASNLYLHSLHFYFVLFFNFLLKYNIHRITSTNLNLTINHPDQDIEHFQHLRRYPHAPSQPITHPPWRPPLIINYFCLFLKFT